MNKVHKSTDPCHYCSLRHASSSGCPVMSNLPPPPLVTDWPCTYSRTQRNLPKPRLSAGQFAGLSAGNRNQDKALQIFLAHS